MTLPFILKVAMAVVIAVSVSAAAAARPPDRMRPGLTGIVLGASVVIYGLAAILLSSGQTVAGAISLVVASEGMCAAAWLGRAIVGGSDDDGDGGGGWERPSGPSDVGPSSDNARPAVDWSAFESFRRSWSRERAGRNGD